MKPGEHVGSAFLHQRREGGLEGRFVGDETLAAGGEGILASKGDLGQILFSASAGLADLSRSLTELRSEADGFYKFRGRSGELSDLKGRLAVLKVERERIDTLASHYAQLVEIRGRMTAQYEKAIGERGKIQSRTIQRILNALCRLHLREADLKIAGLLSRLDRKAEAEPARLVLNASVVGALRGLIETRSGVAAAATAAADELSEAKRRLDEARGKLDEAGDRPDAGQRSEARIAALAATVAALRAGDHSAAAALPLGLALRTLSDRIGELRPWQGDVETLVTMAIPQPETMECWKVAVAEAQKRIDTQAGEVERLTMERVRLKAELGAIGGVVAVVSDAETAKIRARREQAWASHRRTLDAGSADVFEGALRHDDMVTNARLGHAADLAKLQQTTVSLAVLEADLGRAHHLLDATETAFRFVRAEIAGALRAMAPALPDAMPLSQLEGWVARRIKALETRESVLAAERDVGEADADAEAARERLTAALGAAGVFYEADASFEMLLAMAQAAIDRETELRSLRDAVNDRQRDLTSSR